MKKFFSWLGCLILSVILATAGATALLSCEGGPKLLPTQKTVDVKATVDSIVNPVFTTTSDVLELQETLRSNAFIDSVFLAMPPNIVKNVASVVLKKLSFAQKSDIVGEYLKNKQIYESLPPPDSTSNVSITTTKTEGPTPVPGVSIVKESTTTVTEAPPTGVTEAQPNGSYKDTIINGKHALVKQ